MEGKLYFAPDPFVIQNWQGFKSCDCVISGQFLKMKERQKFKISSLEEMTIPLIGSSCRKVAHHKKHLFELKTSSSSKYLFFANSKEEAEKWTNKLNSLSAQCEPHQTEENESMNIINKEGNNMSIKYNEQGSDGLETLLMDGNKNDKLITSVLDVTSMASPKASLRNLQKRSLQYDPLSNHGTGLFGVPLHLCMMSPNQQHVPLVIVTCVEMIERHALQHQGIYRVPGNGSLVNSLCNDLNTSRRIDVEDERWKDVNVVTSLLKMFFRKLPDSLITNQLYRNAIEAVRKIGGEAERMERLKQVICSLPLYHRETFKYIAVHLRKVSTHGSVNKMDIKNLSIIFGPTLVCSRQECSLKHIVLDMPDQCRVVETIVTNIDFFFNHQQSLKQAISSGVSLSEENSRSVKQERKESEMVLLNISNDNLSNNTFFSSSSLFSAFAPLIDTFERFEVTENLERKSDKKVSQKPLTRNLNPSSLRTYKSLDVCLSSLSDEECSGNQPNSSQKLYWRTSVLSCNDLDVQKRQTNREKQNEPELISPNPLIRAITQNEDLVRLAVEHLMEMGSVVKGLQVRQQELAEERRIWKELKEAVSLRCGQRNLELKIC